MDHDLEQLTLFTNVPEHLIGVCFPLSSGGKSSYRVIERWGAWDTIFCSFFNGETAYMHQTVFRTAQAAHSLTHKGV
jgi:hypothetical protein